MSSKSVKTSFGLSPLFIVVLALLTAIAPLATDMYLAALPAVAENLNTTSTNASLTLSAFMVGMALGQLVVGPLSDKTGRRKPLLIGAVVCFIATVACGFAPNIELLILARFMMGFTGSIGAVLARSIVADTTEGLATAKLMGVMMMINGFAPVLAPLFGGWVLSWGSWRDIFHVLGVITAIMMLGVIFVIKETLPVEERYQGTALSVYSELPKVFKIRRYLGFMLTMCFAFGALFSYISGSTFVLQKILGLSETEFTIVFGVNSIGIVLFSAIATKLVGRVAQRRIVNIGVVSLLVVSSLLAGAKTLSYAVNMAVLRYVQERGADDAIFITDERRVLEGATSSVLVAKIEDGKKVLYTPEPSHGILPGTTQGAVFEAARQAGWELGFGPLYPQDLFESDGVWLASSVRLIAPVTHLNGTALAHDPELTATLLNYLAQQS